MILRKNYSDTFLRAMNICFILSIVLIYHQSNCLDLNYMESLCGTSTSFTTSFQLDSSTGITYKNLLDCDYTVTAPSNHYVLALITRFELESVLTGSCTDYLDVHDGPDLSSAKLISDLCGTGSSIPSNFTSTGQSMTLRLVTDNKGVYTGFNIIFVAFTNAPCESSYYACNQSLCIDSSLECDGYNQCGDSSDEENCAAKLSSEGPDIVMIVLITLLCVAAIACIVAYIVYTAYSRNRWKKFLNSHIDDDDGIVAAGPSYPITHKYYRGIRGHPAYYVNSAPLQVDTDANIVKGKLEGTDPQTSTSSSLS